MDVTYLPLDAHQLDQIKEEFELVIFTGILYHLKNPLQVLEEVGRVCRDAVIIETEVLKPTPLNVVYARQGPHGKVKVTECHTGIMKFIEKDELNGDGSNWWVPDTECVLGMLRTAGFRYFSAPVHLTETRLMLIASKQHQSLLNLQALK
jgi:tRNA (mo5U34)-methyltransferase